MTIVQPNYPAPAFPMTPRDVTDIVTLVIHHSDGAPDQSPLDVDAEHRAEGWAMIGYNFFIGGDGTVYRGRPTNVVPSAAYGYNTPSVDVCLAGDFEPGTSGFQAEVPPVQLQSLKDLSVLLHQHYPTISLTIGHGDVATMFYPNDTADYSTACPGSVLEALIPSIRSYTAGKLNK
jgi:hypothetical protein